MTVQEVFDMWSIYLNETKRTAFRADLEALAQGSPRANDRPDDSDVQI